MKIHACQMTHNQKAEVRDALTTLFKRHTFQVLDHARIQMKRKGITWKEALKTIGYGEIIELKDEGTVRVVVRHNLNDRAVCAVVDLTGKQVVTAWVNEDGDTHRTLDLSVYDGTLNVRQVVRKVIQPERGAR